MVKSASVNDQLHVLEPGLVEQYQDQGYLFIESFVGSDELARLTAATDEVIERSRAVTRSDDVFILETAHRPDAPRLRRLNRAADHHPAFYDYAFTSRLSDLVADLIGPDIKFRECMMNFKWAGGGQPVGWHQDLPFYPHTNTTPLITLTYLTDVTEDMGPLMVVPGSHKGPLFDHHNGDGTWRGSIAADDEQAAGTGRAVSLPGPAGSLIVIHGGMVHGSARNTSSRSRPVLICGYSSADAFCYVPLGTVSRYTWQIVRGKPALFARHEPGSFRVPPDWSTGYTSIFEDQQAERRKAG